MVEKQNNKILLKARRTNILFMTSFVIVLAQQIYFPQRYKYFHLALIFLYMVFHDLLKPQYRTYSYDYFFMISILGCSIVSVIEKMQEVNLSVLYLALLVISTCLAIRYMLILRKTIISKKIHDRIDEKGSNLLQKGTKFLSVLFLMIILVLILAIGYVIFMVFM